MNVPQFNAEASLGPAVGTYRGKAVDGGFPPEGGGGVMPQIGFQSDPDLGAYWRCRANGGSDLICRFFGGLPPFTIGGFLTWSIAGVNLAGPSPIGFGSLRSSHLTGSDVGNARRRVCFLPH